MLNSDHYEVVTVMRPANEWTKNTVTVNDGVFALISFVTVFGGVRWVS